MAEIIYISAQQMVMRLSADQQALPTQENIIGSKNERMENVRPADMCGVWTFFRTKKKSQIMIEK